jgi:hypothetical protein
MENLTLDRLNRLAEALDGGIRIEIYPLEQLWISPPWWEWMERVESLRPDQITGQIEWHGRLTDPRQISVFGQQEIESLPLPPVGGSYSFTMDLADCYQ